MPEKCTLYKINKIAVFALLSHSQETSKFLLRLRNGLGYLYSGFKLSIRCLVEFFWYIRREHTYQWLYLLLTMMINKNNDNDNDNKRDKYADLKLGVKSLYPGHKVSGREVVFDFLGAYSINIQKKLAKFLEDKKVVNVTIERSQKWIVSQNCVQVVKKFTLHRHCLAKRKILGR